MEIGVRTFFLGVGVSYMSLPFVHIIHCASHRLARFLWMFLFVCGGLRGVGGPG